MKTDQINTIVAGLSDVLYHQELVNEQKKLSGMHANEAHDFENIVLDKKADLALKLDGKEFPIFIECDGKQYEIVGSKDESISIKELDVIK